MSAVNNSTLGYCNGAQSLNSIFEHPETITQAISLLRKDRIFNTSELTGFLTSQVSEYGQLPKVDDRMIQNHPAKAMLILILRGDETDVELRGQAANSYISLNPTDTLFQKNYAYLKTPAMLMAHLLIQSGHWVCANPENTDLYPEQMAGLFHGTIAFDRGDIITPEEQDLIHQADESFTAKNLKFNETHYEVVKWCSTRSQNNSSERLKNLYIQSRREIQESVVANTISSLAAFSTNIQEHYHIDKTQKAVICVIGPIKVGKNHFIKNELGNDAVWFCLDEISKLFVRNVTDRPQDFKFEAMLVRGLILTELDDKILAFVDESACIDEYRFSRVTDHIKKGRQLIIEEIAPEKVDPTKISEMDAQKFRAERIKLISENPKIQYTLYQRVNNCFEKIASKNFGESLVIEQADLYEQLTR